ncbi:peptidoglycan-binding domain-containing protein [Streptomyces sp. NPDC002403]
MERDSALPELLRIRRLPSRLDIPPWTIKIHCQGVHSKGSASNYGYTLTVDGRLGESTDVAVRAVQRCSGLNPDGQVGSRT